MFFRSHNRFRGYWLSILSWLILSFAAPLSQAMADDVGFMRLCSALGVQWVLSESSDDESVGQLCPCLGFALTNAATDFALNDTFAPLIEQPSPSQAVITRYALQQPRSPPSA